MKSALILLIAAVLVGYFTFGRGSASQRVAEDFVEALNEGEWDTAAELSTGEANQLIQFARNFTEGKPPQGGPVPEFSREEIDGDEGKVYFELDGSEDFVEVRKVDGEWKVSRIPK
jgi:hypothetical protein